MGGSDITSINPGKRDHVYIGKFEGKSQYIQKQYFLRKLRDVLDMGMKLPLFRMTVQTFRIELRKSYLFRSYTTFSKATSNKFGIEISLVPCVCARYVKMCV